MVELVGIEVEVEEDVTFGTCELCMSVDDLTVNYLVFRDENKEEYKLEMGSWSWGDYIRHYDWIHDFSLVEFMDFFDKQGVRTFKELEEKFDDIYYNFVKLKEI